MLGRALLEARDQGVRRRGRGIVGGGVGKAWVRSRAAARSSRSVWKVWRRLSKRRVRLPMGVPESLAGGKSKPPDMMVYLGDVVRGTVFGQVRRQRRRQRNMVEALSAAMVWYRLTSRGRYEAGFCGNDVLAQRVTQTWSSPSLSSSIEVMCEGQDQGLGAFKGTSLQDCR